MAKLDKIQQGVEEAARNVTHMKLKRDDAGTLLAQQVWMQWAILAELTELNGHMAALHALAGTINCNVKGITRGVGRNE